MPNKLNSADYDLSDGEITKYHRYAENHRVICPNNTFRLLCESSGIGIKSVVKCVKCDDEHDITDYDLW